MAFKLLLPEIGDYGIKDVDGGTAYRINNSKLIIGALIIGKMMYPEESQ